MFIFKDKWEKLENEFVSVIVGHTQVRVGIPKFWNLVPKNSAYWFAMYLFLYILQYNYSSLGSSINVNTK